MSGPASTPRIGWINLPISKLRQIARESPTFEVFERAVEKEASK